MSAIPCCVVWLVGGRGEFCVVNVADVDRWLLDGWTIERIEPAPVQYDATTRTVPADVVQREGFLEHLPSHRVEEHVARPRPVPPPTRLEQHGGRTLHVVDRVALEARQRQRERRGTSQDGDTRPTGDDAVMRVFGDPTGGLPRGRLVDSDY